MVKYKLGHLLYGTEVSINWWEFIKNYIWFGTRTKLTVTNGTSSQTKYKNFFFIFCPFLLNQLYNITLLLFHIDFKTLKFRISSRFM